MSEETNQSTEPNEKKESPMLAIIGLFLAFVPSIIFLSVKDVPAFGGSHGKMFWWDCGASLMCCFASSSLLFRHKIAWAIIVGFLFLLLNAAISFLLGCGAVLSG